MLAETRTSTAARAHARLGRPRPIARDSRCWLCAACRTPRVMLHARCCTSQPTRLAQPLNRLHEVGLRVVRPRPPVVPMSNRRRLHTRLPVGARSSFNAAERTAARARIAPRRARPLPPARGTRWTPAMQHAIMQRATMQLCNMLQCNSLGEPGRCRSLEEHQRS